MTDAAFEEMHLEMLNWLRWCQSDGSVFSHCASIEHLYVAEKLTEATQAQRTKKNADGPIDHIKGENIDIALRICSVKSGTFLKAWYYHRVSPEALARHARVAILELDDLRRVCMSDLKRQFDEVSRRRSGKVRIYRELCTIKPRTEAIGDEPLRAVA